MYQYILLFFFLLQELFKYVDRNQDGKITLDEYLDLIGNAKQK